MHTFILPTGYARIKIVHSFTELATTPLRDGVNALCWQRSLDGDFEAVVAALGGGEGIDSIEPEQLRRLKSGKLGKEGRAAVDILLEDQALLLEHGLEPGLDCIHSYPRDDPAALVATDVYSFHVDSAPVAADTWLCAYTGAASEGLRNDQAQRRVEHPATRAALRKRYGAEEGAGFLAFLSENSYDLHYAPTAQATPFSFGLGNLWRIAIQHPGSTVPPCIHRAPATAPGQAPRLLLIS